MPSPELVKLYYRIGEVSEIVGVQPHVLRYWETEFRSIRPQKSSKGQRVYSRRDVEKLLRVKDLLKNQGFTIAGARKRLSEPAEPAAPPSVPVPREAAELTGAASEPAPPASEPQLAAVVGGDAAEADSKAKHMRRALLGLRRELVHRLEEVQRQRALELPAPYLGVTSGGRGAT